MQSVALPIHSQVQHSKHVPSAYDKHLRVSCDPEKKLIIFLKSNNSFVFLIKTRCFVCEVGTEVFKFSSIFDDHQ